MVKFPGAKQHSKTTRIPWRPPTRAAMGLPSFKTAVPKPSQAEQVKPAPKQPIKIITLQRARPPPRRTEINPTELAWLGLERYGAEKAGKTWAERKTAVEAKTAMKYWRGMTLNKNGVYKKRGGKNKEYHEEKWDGIWYDRWKAKSMGAQQANSSS